MHRQTIPHAVLLATLSTYIPVSQPWTQPVPAGRDCTRVGVRTALHRSCVNHKTALFGGVRRSFMTSTPPPQHTRRALSGGVGFTPLVVADWTSVSLKVRPGEWDFANKGKDKLIDELREGSFGPTVWVPCLGTWAVMSRKTLSTSPLENLLARAADLGWKSGTFTLSEFTSLRVQNGQRILRECLESTDIHFAMQQAGDGAMALIKSKQLEDAERIISQSGTWSGDYKKKEYTTCVLHGCRHPPSDLLDTLMQRGAMNLGDALVLPSDFWPPTKVWEQHVWLIPGSLVFPLEQCLHDCGWARFDESTEKRGLGLIVASEYVSVGANNYALPDELQQELRDGVYGPAYRLGDCPREDFVGANQQIEEEFLDAWMVPVQSINKLTQAMAEFWDTRSTSPLDNCGQSASAEAASLIYGSTGQSEGFQRNHVAGGALLFGDADPEGLGVQNAPSGLSRAGTAMIPSSLGADLPGLHADGLSQMAAQPDSSRTSSLHSQSASPGSSQSSSASQGASGTDPPSFSPCSEHGLGTNDSAGGDSSSDGAFDFGDELRAEGLSALLLAAKDMEPSWRERMASQFGEPYFLKLASALKKEVLTRGAIIFPPPDKIFSAFRLTSFDSVRVVIVGQDPYHQPGQAEGLAFSVPYSVTPPPSLRNVFQELRDDPNVEFSAPVHGHLSAWAKQGVLLLNTVLTVEANTPLSHKDLGWQAFTDAAIRQLDAEKEGLIFVLWGANAHKIEVLLTKGKHHVLKASHPSPLAARKSSKAAEAFMGCRHFSKINTLLKQQGKPEVDWRL